MDAAKMDLINASISPQINEPLLKKEEAPH
jgi:hypothetical protein